MNLWTEKAKDTTGIIEQASADIKDAWDTPDGDEARDLLLRAMARALVGILIELGNIRSTLDLMK